MDQATPAHQEVLRHVRECREDANLDRRVGVCAHRHHQKAPRPGCLSLHFITDILGHHTTYSSENDLRSKQLNLFDF